MYPEPFRRNGGLLESYRRGGGGNGSFCYGVDEALLEENGEDREVSIGVGDGHLT